MSESTDSLLKRYSSLVYAMRQMIIAGRKREKTFNQMKGAAWEIYNQLTSRGVRVSRPPS
jgi:hypothetical protein